MSSLSPRVRVMTTLVLAMSAVLAPSAQERPDRGRPPALSAAPSLTLPPVQKRTLANGIPVWIVENREVPLVQVNLLVLAGSSDDPSGKFGAASLTSAMLDEGAGARTSLDISDETEFLGATLATSSSFDASAIRLNVPVARLDAALALMADVTLRPTFPESDLERVRRERLTSLLQARDDPETVAPLAFQRIVFGPTHRFGTSATGTEASIARLTREDVRAFHQRWYQPANARFVVVGAATADVVVAALDKAFGAWANTTPTTRLPVVLAPQVRETTIYIVNHPEAAQSQIRIGRVGVARSTTDFFPLEVLNTVLGGSFTSRLNQNLREEHQYTYGAASRFDMRLSAGPFIAAAGVQTDKTAEALTEFMKELRAIGAPIPADELARAKNYLALGFPADFETSRDMAVRLEELIIYGLPDDYFSRYVGNVQGVTPAAAQRVAQAHIQPAQLAIVIVGDQKIIEPAVRALNIAPVRVMSVEEALGAVSDHYYHSHDLPRFSEVGKDAPELWQKFSDWYAAVFKDGALSEREKALIALAVAHAVQCPYCIDVYSTESLQKGSTPEQMTEAVHVAAAIRGGASLVHGVQMRNRVDKLSM